MVWHPHIGRGCRWPHSLKSESLTLSMVTLPRMGVHGSMQAGWLSTASCRNPPKSPLPLTQARLFVLNTRGGHMSPMCHPRAFLSMSLPRCLSWGHRFFPGKFDDYSNFFGGWGWATLHHIAINPFQQLIIEKKKNLKIHSNGGSRGMKHLRWHASEIRLATGHSVLWVWNQYRGFCRKMASSLIKRLS
jgi:hypothetical protein